MKTAIETAHSKKRRPILSEYEIASLKLIIAYQNLEHNVLNVPFDWKSRAYRACVICESKLVNNLVTYSTTNFPLDMPLVLVYELFIKLIIRIIYRRYDVAE